MCVWRNPDSKIFQIVKYLLETSSENSRTWSTHLRNLSNQYDLADPLECLRKDLPSRSQYKEHIQTKICAFYENSLRALAARNSQMNYLNVSLTGLRGRRHPALSELITSVDVKNSRIHLKMLAGDYFTYDVKANHSGGSPHCRCCPTPSPNENLVHILTNCGAYADIRKKMFPEYENLCDQSKSRILFQEISSENITLCQFILDPASFNLQNRIHLNDPILGSIFKLSRDYCNAINSARMKIIRRKENEQVRANSVQLTS